MRVVHLSDHYLPTLGGIETHVGALAQRQAHAGDDVTVLTSTPTTADGRWDRGRPGPRADGWGDRERVEPGPVRVVRRRSALDGPTLHPDRVDLVHAHVSVVSTFAAPLAAAAAHDGIPTVVTVHSLWDGTGPTARLGAALTGLRRAPVTWTAVSEVAAEQVRRRLPAGTEVTVLPNAVSVSPRAATPVRGDDEPVRLVSTMRLARRKRPEALLDVVAQVRERSTRPVTLVLVGDGPLRRRVEARATRLGLDDVVTVTGRLAPGEVQQRLAEADVYVAPAVLESFGLAPLEARCVGLPVVGRTGTGLAEFVVDGRHGLLVPSDAAMVDALVRLVDDPALRHRIAEHDRTTPSAHTWEAALARHDATYAATRARRAARAAGRSGEEARSDRRTTRAPGRRAGTP